MTRVGPTSVSRSPPALADRDGLRREVGIAVARVRAGRSAKSLILLGPRGAERTALLERLRLDVEGDGAQAVWMETAEDRSLPGLLVRGLRDVLLRLSKVDAAKDTAQRALRALAGFAKGLNAKYHDIESVLDAEPELGLADHGDLENDLLQLLEVAGKAAKRAGSALVLCIDELQHVEDRQLGALIAALHRANQDTLPVILIGAGLLQMPGRIGDAKGYAERMFNFKMVGDTPE